MKFVLAGASGFLGSTWTEHLNDEGHEVVRLVRRPAGAGESSWDPYAGKVDLDLIESADVVANLAGAPLAHFPWTASYKKTFRDSRLVTTTLLAEAIAASSSKPVFLAQNGIAGYGDRGDTVLDESSPTDADTFLGEVTREWETAAQAAADGGARVVVLRTAVVLDRRGGALKSMLPAFKLGLGGPIAGGRQYFATVSLDDWLRSATYLAGSAESSGAYNLTGQVPATNREYTKALAAELHRPAFFPIPGLPIKALAGPVASEILGSVRVEPRRLLDEGFHFLHPTVEEQVKAALA